MCTRTPEYDARYASLYVRWCWQLSCFPEALAQSTITAAISWSAGRSSLPSGRYVLRARGPPSLGQNKMVVTANVTTGEAAPKVLTATNGSIITVPQGVRGVGEGGWCKCLGLV